MRNFDYLYIIYLRGNILIWLQAFLTAWKNTCGAEGTATLVIPPRKSFMVTNLILSGSCNATSIYIQVWSNILIVFWGHILINFSHFRKMLMFFFLQWKPNVTRFHIYVFITFCWELFLVLDAPNIFTDISPSSLWLQLEGQIVAPSKGAWKDKSYWIRIEYVNGLTIDGNGGIDGYGSTWWQCKTCPRPSVWWCYIYIFMG